MIDKKLKEDKTPLYAFPVDSNKEMAKALNAFKKEGEVLVSL